MIWKSNEQEEDSMNLQYTITMTASEKDKYKQLAVTTKVLLSEYADSIQDHEERSKVWDKIRKFNQLMEIFTA